MNLKSVRFFPHWKENSISQVTGFLHLINYILKKKSEINNWLEIGSHLGESATLLMGFPQIKKIHLIEISKYSCKILSDKLKDKIESKKCFIYNDSSKNILSSCSNTFDCIYIDGDHKYESVIEDIELSHNKIQNDGFLCGHDYNKAWTGVMDAVDFFVLNSNYTKKDLILFEDSSWLLRKK